MAASRLGLTRGIKGAWTPVDVKRLAKLVAQGLSWEQIASHYPGRTPEAIREKAGREGMVRPKSEYVTATAAAHQAKMSVGTIVSLVRYSDFYSHGVQKKTDKTTVLYLESDIHRAIHEWVDLMTLRQYAIYAEIPYTTLQSQMRQMGVRFRTSVEQGHRKLLLSEWEALFDGREASEELFEISASTAE